MTGSASTVKRNTNLTYTINIKNNGPEKANDVTLTDKIPTGMRYISASTSQGSCSGTSTVTCKLGALVNGASAKVLITVQPRYATTYTNTASVTSSTFDNVSTNNSASVTTKAR
jgi:uncharacterized repeat protein (TIGR01451 family)